MPVSTMSTADSDGIIESFVAAKSFLFKGRRFHPGDPITVAVYTHPRFETLVHTGRVKAV